MITSKRARIVKSPHDAGFKVIRSFRYKIDGLPNSASFETNHTTQEQAIDTAITWVTGH